MRTSGVGRGILSKWDRVIGGSSIQHDHGSWAALKESWPWKIRLTAQAWALAGAGEGFQIKPWSSTMVLLSLVLSSHFWLLSPSYIFLFNLSKTDLEFLASGMLLKTAYSEKLAFHKYPDLWRREHDKREATDIPNLGLFVCLAFLGMHSSNAHILFRYIH